MSEAKKDSIIKYNDSTIYALENVIEKNNDQLFIAEALVNSQRSDIKKLKLHRTLLFSGLGICIISILALLL